ncbi:hypothetical protein Acy02nite_59840 [Actinoplanes cyaneus]|uniref:AbiEi antitoxin N-terminal domain-containing protein n=1 Tax=Actinoplanes cyaneus TaxID=52696 RepID=A0A919IMI7_9ACTN|nr:type IV toxin-antitoxin system AbiEi family antitoxin domain-containing protein [Actinoplanes cyaneus]GID68103.1 hypothetical protein Acy02nite_59840 [Actinoplanes cyaneus]
MTELDAISRRQRGVVTRPQALQNGMSPTDLHELIRSGHWQRLMPGIYATFAGLPPPAAMRWAAVLYSGRGAMLCHRSAAEETGLAEPVPGAVHVLIPENRRVRPHPAIVIHRSRHAPARRDPRRRPPQTRVEDTVLDLASTSAGAREAQRWITSACIRRLTTAERLADALSHRPRLIRGREIAALVAGAVRGTSELPAWPAD